MPEFLKQELQKEAVKKGMKGRRKDRYVYGTLNAIGAMHGSKTTEKGREMERKHDAHLSPKMTYRR